MLYCGAVLKKGHPYQVSFGTGAGWSGLDEGALFYPCHHSTYPAFGKNGTGGLSLRRPGCCSVGRDRVVETALPPPTTASITGPVGNARPRGTRLASPAVSWRCRRGSIHWQWTLVAHEGGLSNNKQCAHSYWTRGTVYGRRRNTHCGGSDLMEGGGRDRPTPCAGWVVSVSTKREIPTGPEHPGFPSRFPYPIVQCS